MIDSDTQNAIYAGYVWFCMYLEELMLIDRDDECPKQGLKSFYHHGCDSQVY